MAMLSERDDPPTVRLTPAEEIGEIVAKRYQLVAPLGEGGFGVVWRAQDRYLGDQEVALKFLPSSLAGDDLAQTDFRREALVAMSLAHPQLVRLHCMDLDGDQPFLVMEFLRGPTLSQVLARRGPLTPEEVREVGAQVCDGLAHAHSEGVVHLDLKPSNLMLAEPLPSPEASLCGSDVRIKITDFGIARVMIDTSARLRDEPSAGTLAYMSPEVICGRSVDQHADIYSLGCVLYHLVSGRRPFQTGDLTHQHLHAAPQCIVDCPDDLWQIISKCLEKEPSARFRSAAELAAALRDESHPSGRSRLQIAAVAAALAAGLVVGAVWTSATRPQANLPTEPVQTPPVAALDEPVAGAEQTRSPQDQGELIAMAAETISDEGEPTTVITEPAQEPEPPTPAAPTPESHVAAERSDHPHGGPPGQLRRGRQREERETQGETSPAAEADEDPPPRQRETPRARARRIFVGFGRGVVGAVQRVGDDLEETVTDIRDYIEEH